jgi:hypothetical protein
VSLKPRHGLRGLVACLGLALAAAAPAAIPAPANAAAPLSWAVPQSIAGAGGASITSLSCASSSLCVAVDGSGSVLGGNPHSGSSWSAKLAGSFEAVSCASGSLCVAVGSGKPDVATGSPSGGWSALGLTIDPQPITGVSCPTGGLCVAVDQAGDVLTSTDPSSAVSWGNHGTIDGGVPLRSVSCSSDSLCVAVDEDGVLLASSAPSSESSWRPGFDSVSMLTGISCAEALCAAVSEAGGAIASSDPVSVSPAPTWSYTPTGGGRLAGVSCVSSGLCVAVEAGAQAYASDDPDAPAPGWSASTIEHSPTSTAVSCLAEGFCIAADADGEVSLGEMPAPAVSTGESSGLTQTTATVAGTVDPQDAPLGSCRFEYGTTNSYAQSAPCSSTPGPGSAVVEVSASIAGLTAATTYRYRLTAASATGQGVGAEGTFTTTAPSTAQLVHPAPYITGVPANGDRLSCNPGTHGAEASIAYAWWRNASPIAGATNQIYHIGPEDAGQHLQCEAIAADAAGSASARSAFVAVPAEGLPIPAGETVIGTARISGGLLELPVRCSPQADPACELELRLTAVETLRGKKLLAVTARAPKTRSPRERSQTVTLLSRKATVPTGKQRTIAVALNATGKRLVAQAKRLSAQLTVEGTVIGVLSATLAKEQVSVVLPAAAAGEHHHRRVDGARRRL